jgi:nucleoid DNA-binding protein
MALTKTQRVYSIHKQVDSLLEIIKKTLGDGEDVLISGFGKFCLKEKGKRRGRNPHTGEEGADRLGTGYCDRQQYWP